MNDNIEKQSMEISDQNKRTLIFSLIGVIIVGTCVLFLLVYSWFQPGQTSLISKYFPSSTPTLRPTGTPAPTQALAANMIATQRAWIKPTQSPSLGNADEVESAMDFGFAYLEYYSFVAPDLPSITQPGDVYIYALEITEFEPLIWSYGWCTITQDILEENFAHIQLEFILNKTVVPPDHFAVLEYSREDGSPCREYAALVTLWPEGLHRLESRVTFTENIDDGWDVYPAGTHSYEYFVTAKK